MQIDLTMAVIVLVLGVTASISLTAIVSGLVLRSSSKDSIEMISSLKSEVYNSWEETKHYRDLYHSGQASLQEATNYISSLIAYIVSKGLSDYPKSNIPQKTVNLPSSTARTMVELFSKDEIMLIAQDMNIDADIFSDGSRSSLAIDFVNYVNSQKRSAELLRILTEQRPFQDWQSFQK